MPQYRVTVNGKSYDVVVENIAGGATVPVPASAPAAAAPVAAPVPEAPAAPAPAPAAETAPAPAPAAPAPAGAKTVCAPMPGKILRVCVAVGDKVTSGQNLMILEAMKMENEIPADSDGTVVSISVSEGSSVNTGDALIVIG